MLPIFSFLGFLAAFLFGVIAVFLSVKEDKNRKLSVELEAKREDLTHSIIHELRAPLSAIKDSAELMLSDKTPLAKEEQEQYLKIIHDQSKMLLDQVGSLLDAAKLEAGKFTINKSEGNIIDIIKERMIAFGPQAKKKEINLMLSTNDPIPPFAFDHVRISQVINNLLSNSLKFTKNGGKITITALQKDKGIEVSIYDDGIEIPKDDQKNLFSKFKQASNIPQELAKEGTGLGLYVVKGIVEAHGGTVGVKSNPGDGTTISFTLPVK